MGYIRTSYKRLLSKIQPECNYQSMDSPIMTTKELKQLKKLLNSFVRGYRMSLKEGNELDSVKRLVNRSLNNQITQDKDIVKKRIKSKIDSIRYKIYELLGGE